MSADETASVTGLVLAGGRGSRMGGADKGWIAYDEVPLIERVIGRLRPQVDDLLISANRNLERYRALGVTTLTDDMRIGEFAGPLAGVLAGFGATRHPWLAVVPCDAPDLPPDLVRRLRAGAATANRRSAVACSSGRMQPLFCLLHRDLRQSLEAFLEAGERKVADWLVRIEAVSVAFEDARAFVNVNAPHDLPATR